MFANRIVVNSKCYSFKTAPKADSSGFYSLFARLYDYTYTSVVCSKLSDLVMFLCGLFIVLFFSFVVVVVVLAATDDFTEV